MRIIKVVYQWKNCKFQILTCTDKSKCTWVSYEHTIIVIDVGKEMAGSSGDDIGDDQRVFQVQDKHGMVALHRFHITGTSVLGSAQATDHRMHRSQTQKRHKGIPLAWLHQEKSTQ